MNFQDPILAGFHAHCDRDPDQPAIEIIGEGGSSIYHNRRELRALIRDTAARFQSQGITPGDKVLIKLSHGDALLRTLLGCFELGAIPCLLPWRFAHAGSPGDLKRLDLQATSIEAEWLITTPAIKESWLSIERNWRVELRTFAEATAKNHDTVADFKPAQGEATAYLQFTSGTTGAGRTAELSAQAIQHCLHRDATKLDLGTKDRVLNWLPLYHDLGLFAGLLLPLLSGARIIWMSPVRFLRRPAEFLDTIDRKSITVTFATNAALHQLAGLPETDTRPDLSSLKRFICGGEPIRHESLRRFEDLFKTQQFDPASWVIGYGMAETVVGVIATDPRTGQTPRTDWVESHALKTNNQAVACEPDKATAIPIVTCGQPWHRDELKIIDENGTDLAERVVGEVCLRGPFLFSGYYRQPEETAKVMRDGWLYTGDLGYLADGHLYICGRRKDLIIVGGTNIHPEEIEAAAQTVSGLSPGRLVAFGAPNDQTGTEGIIVVMEIARQETLSIPSLEAAVRQRITEQVGLAPQRILSMPRGWIIKTSSGKLSRHKCRTKYLNHE